MPSPRLPRPTGLDLVLLATVVLFGLAVAAPWRRAEALRRNEEAALAALAQVGRFVLGKVDPGGEHAPPSVEALLRPTGILAGSGPEGGPTFPEGTLPREGYLYRVRALPRTDPAAAGTWFLVAWPLVYGETGNALFAIDEAGRLFENRNARRQYGGLANAPDSAGLPRASREGTEAEDWRLLPGPVQK